MTGDGHPTADSVRKLVVGDRLAALQCLGELASPVGGGIPHFRACAAPDETLRFCNGIRRNDRMVCVDEPRQPGERVPHQVKALDDLLIFHSNPLPDDDVDSMVSRAKESRGRARMHGKRGSATHLALIARKRWQCHAFAAGESRAQNNPPMQNCRTIFPQKEYRFEPLHI